MRRSSGTRSRNAILILAPLTVLAVLALILSRSVFGSPMPSSTALTAQELAGSDSAPTTAARTEPTGSTGSAPTAPMAPTASVTPTALPLLSLGTATGTLTLRGPKAAPAGTFAVFVIDGPRRQLRTDATAPFTITLNTKRLPNGTYTISVLTVRKGQSSTVSTSTVKIKNMKPKPTPTMTTPVTTAPTAGTPNSNFASQVLALTNAQRHKAGCGALTDNAKLDRAAQGHSADMAAKNYFDHNSKNGESPFDRMTDVGYKFSAAAENIAMGQQTPADVMTAWMNSPGHKANILNCAYTDLGVGYAVGNGSPYWTQDFGKPL